MVQISHIVCVALEFNKLVYPRHHLCGLNIYPSPMTFNFFPGGLRRWHGDDVKVACVVGIEFLSKPYASSVFEKLQRSLTYTNSRLFARETGF